jgi:hypothetical protein
VTQAAGSESKSPNRVVEETPFYANYIGNGDVDAGLTGCNPELRAGIKLSLNE